MIEETLRPDQVASHPETIGVSLGHPSRQTTKDTPVETKKTWEAVDSKKWDQLQICPNHRDSLFIPQRSEFSLSFNQRQTQ